MSYLVRMGAPACGGPVLPTITNRTTMSVSLEEVRYIAQLARLRFTDEEEQEMARQMSRILDYMDQLSELDTTDVPPMSHVLELTNVFRTDEVQQRITRDDALRNAPEADDTYFRVPKVID